MIPSIERLAEALTDPACCLRSLFDAHIPTDDNGVPLLARTSLFVEARIEWEGARWLLCCPLREESIRRVEPVAFRLKRFRPAWLTGYEILRDEVRLPGRREVMSDAVLHRLPDGEPLSEAAPRCSAARLLDALSQLQEQMEQAQFRHNNLRPENLYVTTDGRLVPVRYHYARFDRNHERAAFEQLRRWIGQHAATESTDAQPQENPVATSFYRSSSLPLNDSLRIVGDPSGGYLYVDADDRPAFDGRFDWADDFFEGRAAVRIGDRMGLIDKSGRYVIEPECEIVDYNGYTGFSRVRRQGKWARFDYMGTQLTEFAAACPDDPFEERA